MLSQQHLQVPSTPFSLPNDVVASWTFLLSSHFDLLLIYLAYSYMACLLMALGIRREESNY